MAGELVKEAAPKAQKLALVSDDNVAELYLERLVKSFEKQGFDVCTHVFPHGESSKNSGVFLEILNFFSANKLSRSDLAIALGGGVVGDVTGFAAACYLRGIGYVQIPTSLLAMVDSSVGGKTAINLDSGKNLAGAFRQPELVLCDLDSLETLPAEFFTDGCAEAFKYSVLGDRELFEHLLAKGQNFHREYVISRCIEMKRDYVCADEFDMGLRQKLNLGHTIGHAIEKCSDYKVSHGNAVAIGMAMIAKISAAHGLCSKACAQDLICGLKALNLPTETEFTTDELLLPMLSDKKCSGGKINLIIPREIGNCEILPVENIKEFLEK